MPGNSSIGNTGPVPSCGVPSSRVSRSASLYSPGELVAPLDRYMFRFRACDAERHPVR
jgi:hypothetical protein